MRHRPPPLRIAPLRSLSTSPVNGGGKLFFNARDLPHDQFINLQPLYASTSHTHAPNRQRTDGKRADRERPKRQRAGGNDKRGESGIGAVRASHSSNITVMAGLVPATHEHPCNREIMGPRHKAGDDVSGIG